MAAERPPIPQPLRRQVLMEAGYRCAIPTCRQIPVDLHHIIPWATVKAHTFDNLIALCRNDHGLAGDGVIDRKALALYKRNLSLVNSRYGDMERRLIGYFAQNPDIKQAGFPTPHTFEFMNLLDDGLVSEVHSGMNVMGGGFDMSPKIYVLTPAGIQFVSRWAAGLPVAEE